METLAIKKLNDKTLFQIIEKINNNEIRDIDISEIVFCKPFYALVLATELANFCKRTGRKIRLNGYSEDIDVHTFLGHIGFFKTALHSIGKEPGEARGSNKYIPLTKLSKKYFIQKQQELEDDRGITRPLNYFIQKEAEKLACLVSTKPNDIEAISYCFREIIRNVFEHSDAEECVICGQKWRNGYVEVGIVDNGCGIFASLKSRHNFASEEEALHMSLQPGISGKDITQKEIHSNSGFGLFVLSELGKRFGKFSLYSGESGISYQNGKIKINKFSYHGTAVRMYLNIENDILEAIQEIIDYGENIASAKGRTVKASKLSRMLW